VSLFFLTAIGLALVRRALAREQAARRLRDDFVANVTHEIRTPLTSVVLHAEMLAEGDLSAERRREAARVVEAEGARLAALVDDLLDFSALERGARRLEPEPVNVAAAVRQVAAPWRTLAERERVDFEVDVPDAPLPALADPHALTRILANLLGNAWKHGRPSRNGGGSRLRVRAVGGPEPFVEVRDDGPGIPEDERATVFERFRRGWRAARTQGTGIGLALSRDLARAMGGDLAVVEDPEETVFRLTLPPVPETRA
jgi:signal transduction histidine kinase